MLSVKLEENSGVALFEPHGALSEADFRRAAGVVDTWLAKHARLQGLVIHTPKFPGWDSFGALLGHLVFIRDHHKRIGRVAFATDTPVGPLAEKLARHFVRAEIRLFPYRELDAARAWAAHPGTPAPD